MRRIHRCVPRFLAHFRRERVRVLARRAACVSIGWATLAVGLAGCPDDPDRPRIPDDIFAPLGEPVPFATEEQRETFERGREVLLRHFGPSDGLGPHFNLTSCGGCHEKPVPGGSAGRYRNFLLVQRRTDDGAQIPVGVNGVQPHFHVQNARHADAEGANVLAIRNPIPMFGVGLIAELPERSILANADPEDRDGDGISGRPNYDRGFVGRFGRKSQTVSIEGFIRGPLFNHLGMTTDPLSDELKARLPVPSVRLPAGRSEALRASDGDVGAAVLAQAAAPDEPTRDMDGVPDPELSAQDLFDLVSFSMLLAAPLPDEPTPRTEEGRQLFHRIGCASCHVPALEGPRGLIPLYSDLLLHDMGPELADGIVMGMAGPSEFRTQPLWGVAATAPYLHDGRADTLDEAIRWHGGEAQAARDRYVAASDDDRAKIIEFLESLGGRSQRSEGLLPPGAPLPEPGMLAGPVRPLDPAERERFLAGRAVFDRDRGPVLGLGPRFNGDSCRACHFQPVIGGAGPSDVDVTRQGIRRMGMGIENPSGGTMAHRFDVNPVRPPLDPAADYFERRQTPSLLGLGLLESVPEELLRSFADPDDADGDGIRGRVHVLPDGRIGRFGWKADVPSLAEFARDAMTNELGVTLPAESGHTFGATGDADGAADPELSAEELEALRFFMRMLGPPPRRDRDEPTVRQGERLFAEVGCASCHRVIELPDGQRIEAYTDLLLHDVAPDGFMGVSSADANGREFRTPPLWGIGATAPYMHDGRAETLEAAIAAHGGEARRVVERVSALSSEQRAALLRFLESL
ncbi:MAG: c-type cytochrome [Myxococcota bacterium]|nr:c-type cytochrome [Myxococcota bacterium]MDW8362174.1 di-heme oxidoredictase family protein [Myxococcales bacterium]